MTGDQSKNASTLMGIPIVLSSAARDGVAYMLNPSALVMGPTTAVFGTRPWTDSEKDDEMAKRIVRTGLADVLAWLGDAPGPVPSDPMPLRATVDILASFGFVPSRGFVR